MKARIRPGPPPAIARPADPPAQRPDLSFVVHGESLAQHRKETGCITPGGHTDDKCTVAIPLRAARGSVILCPDDVRRLHEVLFRLSWPPDDAAFRRVYDLIAQAAKRQG